MVSSLVRAITVDCQVELNTFFNFIRLELNTYLICANHKNTVFNE